MELLGLEEEEDLEVVGEGNPTEEEGEENRWILPQDPSDCMISAIETASTPPSLLQDPPVGGRLQDF